MKLKPCVICLLALAVAASPRLAGSQDGRRPERPLLPRRTGPVSIETAARQAAPTPEETQHTEPVDELGQFRRQIAELRRQVAELQHANAVLARDNAQLIEQVGQIAAFDGRQYVPRILANLDTSDRFRQEFLQAVNVRAEVRFYNWRGVPVRMNVNGVWHTLQPGQNVVPVPYGPVVIRASEGRPPRTFTDWTLLETGVVMVFDLGERVRAERPTPQPQP